MAQKPETRFKIRACRDLDTLPYTWYTKVQQVAKRGDPDLIICCNGYFIAIELKASATAKVSKLQEWTVGEIKKARGVALVTGPEGWPLIMEFLREISCRTNAFAI